MRGRQKQQASMLALVDPESRIAPTHPIRAVRRLADAALAELGPVFDAMYAAGGRSSVPPERLLKASLLVALYPVRSERSSCEQLDYNLLFRWLLGMDLVEPSFDPTVFTKNRLRLLRHRIAQEFFDVVVAQPDERRALQRGRHAHRGQRQPQELPPAGRGAAVRPARRPRQPAGRLPRP